MINYKTCNITINYEVWPMKEQIDHHILWNEVDIFQMGEVTMGYWTYTEHSTYSKIEISHVYDTQYEWCILNYDLWIMKQ